MSVLCARRGKEQPSSLTYRPDKAFSLRLNYRVFANYPAQVEMLPRMQLLVLRKILQRFPRREMKGIDDTKSRVNIWKTLFGDEPMPVVEGNAVQKYAGMLDRYIPSNFEIEKVIKKVKKS